MGKLKLAFVLDDTLDTPDGVQQYILTLGAWMTAQGHDIHYIVGKTSRTDIANLHSLGRNVAVRFNGNRMSTPLPADKKAIKDLLEREKFDVLHIQMPYSPFLAGRLINAAPARTAVVGTFHIAPNSGLVSIANRALSLLLDKSISRFDRIFSVSQAAADFALLSYGVRSTVLPNVVNTNAYASALPYGQPKQGEFTIVYLGRLVPRKGCKVLLEALTQLNSSHDTPAYHVNICGRGPLEPELKAYVAANNLASKVTFAGFVTEEEKARHLKSADIAVFPSTGGESFGIVLLEAMAANHPVVLAANNPGYATVMEPHADSLFPVHDPRALAKKLEILMTRPELVKEARRWQQTYISQFDVGVVGARLVARYGEALRTRPH